MKRLAAEVGKSNKKTAFENYFVGAPMLRIKEFNS